MLVEDVDLQAAVIEGYLESCFPQAKVTLVTTQAAALEAIAQTEFDVILLDLGLPDTQGLDTVIRINQAALTVPIVILTSQEDEGLGSLCIQAGAQDFLLKQELAVDDLHRAIDFAVARKSESTLLDLSRVFDQLRTIHTGAANVLAEKFGKIYQRLLSEPRFLLTPDHKKLGWALGQAGATPESVIALHADSLQRVCRGASDRDRARYALNSNIVVLSTVSYLCSYYQQHQK